MRNLPDQPVRCTSHRHQAPPSLEIDVLEHEGELLDELAERWNVSRESVAKMVFSQGALDCRRWLSGAGAA